MNEIKDTDTVQLICAMNAVARHSRAKTYGVLPSDLIRPELFEEVPAYYIFNVEPNRRPGSHWVAVAMDHNDSVFFDPQGFPPEHYGFPFRTKISNTRAVQGPNSNLCGLFVIVFIHYMLKGVSLKKFLSMFKNSAKANDALIYKEFIKLKKCNVPSFCYRQCRP